MYLEGLEETAKLYISVPQALTFFVVQYVDAHLSSAPEDLIGCLLQKKSRWEWCMRLPVRAARTVRDTEWTLKVKLGDS